MTDTLGEELVGHSVTEVDLERAGAPLEPRLTCRLFLDTATLAHTRARISEAEAVAIRVAMSTWRQPGSGSRA